MTTSAPSPLYRHATQRPEGFRDVTPADLRTGLAGVRLIDVREPGEFTGELGHIAGAELVPLGGLATSAVSWDRAAEYLIICRSGGRSARAAMQLHGMGFRKVMNLAGGMMAYNGAGLPVQR